VILACWIVAALLLLWLTAAAHVAEWVREHENEIVPHKAWVFWCTSPPPFCVCVADKMLKAHAAVIPYRPVQRMPDRTAWWCAPPGWRWLAAKSVSVARRALFDAFSATVWSIADWRDREESEVRKAARYERQRAFQRRVQALWSHH